MVTSERRAAMNPDVKLKLMALVRECVEAAQQANAPVERREWLEAADVALHGIESMEKIEALERRRNTSREASK